jgi:hypothetical protein
VEAAPGPSTQAGWRFPFPPDVGPRTRERLNDLQATRVDEYGDVVSEDSQEAVGVLTDGDPAAFDALREGLPEASTLEAWIVEGGDPATLPADFRGELERTDSLLRDMSLPALFAPLLRLRDDAPDRGVDPAALPSLRTLLGDLADLRLRPLAGARGMTRVAVEALDEAALVLLGRKRIFRESPGKAAVKPSVTMWGFRQSVLEAQLEVAGRTKVSTWFREGRDALLLALAAAGRGVTTLDAPHAGALAELVVEALDEDLFLLLATELAERPIDEILGSAVARSSACEPAGFLRIAVLRFQWFVAQTRVVRATRRRAWLDRLRAHLGQAVECLSRPSLGPWALRGIRRAHPGEGVFSDLEGDIADALAAPTDDAHLAKLMARSAVYRVQDTTETYGLVRQLAGRIRQRGLAGSALRSSLGRGTEIPLPAELERQWDALLVQLEARGY